VVLVERRVEKYILLLIIITVIIIIVIIINLSLHPKYLREHSIV
jgi:cell division protein FtsL